MKIKAIITAMAVSAVCAAAQAAPGDVNIIREDQLPAGGVKKMYMADFNYASISSYGVTWASDTNMAMYIYWTGDSEVYVRNLSTMGNAWVKAYVENETLWVPNGQDIMETDAGTLYQLITGTVNMKDNSFEMRTGIKFTMSEDRTELEMEPSPDNKHILGFFTMNAEEGKILQAFSKIRMKEFDQENASPSETAEYKRFNYSAKMGGYQLWQNRSWIAFDGTDVYLQGLDHIHSEGWVKGALMSDGSIRVPSGQFVGMNGNYPDFFFAGRYEGDILDEGTKIEERTAFFFNPDEATGGYVMTEGECFINGKDRVWGYPVTEGTFTPFDIQAGTPTAAEDLLWDDELKVLKFHIPMTDTDGNEIDRYLLKYSIYVNGEKHTFNSSNAPLYREEFDELPGNKWYYLYDIDCGYNFGWNEGDIYVVTVRTDKPIETLGVDMTYDVLGDVRKSEMASIEVTSAKFVSNEARVPVAYLSIDGRALAAPSGICIVKYSDGSAEKVILNH